MHNRQALPMQQLYAWSAAAVAWFGLALQFTLSISQSIDRGLGAWHGVSMYFLFFTVLTNLLAALALILPLIARNSPAAKFFAGPGTITAVATNIILVGVTYNLLLRNVWQPQGLHLIADVLLHDINPVLFVGYWWLFGAGRRIAYAAIAVWCAYPVLYFAYALVRGAAGGFYPYPFIDVGKLGFAHVLLNSVGILTGFVVVAAVLIALGRLKKAVAAPDPA